MPATTTPVVFEFENDHLFGSVTWTLPERIQELLRDVPAEELEIIERGSTSLAAVWLTLITKAIAGGENYKELLKLLRDTAVEAFEEARSIDLDAIPGYTPGVQPPFSDRYLRSDLDSTEGAS